LVANMEFGRKSLSHVVVTSVIVLGYFGISS
jgi:hypothetical protein